MLPEIADFILWLCLLFAAIQLTGFSGERRFVKSASITLFIGISFCFLLLLYSFATSDFSLKIVYENSHTTKPLIYKIAGAWGNHEGSLLLMIWVLAFYGFLYSLTRFNSRALAAQGFVTLLFICFMKFSSNPFAQLEIIPENGIGLNPLLQDIGLALHPPMLYLGYVGFSMVFSISIGALIDGSVDRDYARSAKKWCLVAWSLLTLGIGLGSWWAYRELGWGGFWFWDPVENASLMPWLSGTALLHSLIITEKRKALKKWTALLAIITFGLSLVGFFLVRSGVLNSVHSFANDPERGMFIIAILIVLMGGAFALFGLRAHKLTSQAYESYVSREALILFNNLLLCVLCGTVFIGTIYPLLAEVLFEKSLTVGAPYFNKTFVPISIILIYLCAFATALDWSRTELMQFTKKMVIPEIIASTIAVVLYFKFDHSFKEASAVFVSLFLLGAVLKTSKRKDNLPMILAHGGIIFLTVGVLYTSAFDSSTEKMMKIGDKTEIGEFNINMTDVVEDSEHNYVYRRGIFEVWVENKQLGILYPEMRVYPVEGQTTTESAIMRPYILSDLYIVIGEKNKDSAYAVRVYYKPAVNLIWLGVLLMFAGGAFRLALLVAHYFNHGRRNNYNK